MEIQENNKETKTQPEKKKRKFSLSYLLSGKILTEEFVIKQSKLMILIFVLVVAFISNRYSCAKKLTEMNKLKKELKELQHEKVMLTTRLTAASRRLRIEELLKEKGLGLTNENLTIYEIHK